MKKKLNNNLKINIYRIVQELLCNIVKHTQASLVTLSLQNNLSKVKLIITDNGTGFNSTTKANGIGLKNIKNRISMLNGTFNLKTEPGTGSKTEVILPL